MAIEYIHTAYDFIDNGSGELMLIIGMAEGEADDENARFVYDGFAEGMLVRNSGQIVHLPIIVEGVRGMLGEIKILLVTEMDGDDIYDVYEAPIEILNNDGLSKPLPIPQEVRNGLLKNHIVEE
jgi:hypothetical protein